MQSGEGKQHTVARIWSPYLRTKFLARTTWAVYAFMFVCDMSWILILRVMRPEPGSLLIQLPQYLTILGADSRFIFPVFIGALAVDILSRREPDTQRLRTPTGRAIAVIIVYAVLWIISTLVFVILAILLGGH
jgi:hypothetical protein